MVLRKIENKSFIRSSEGAVASYNWTDIVQQIGYINFYLFSSQNNTTYTYGITGQVFRSKEITTTLSVGGTSATSTSRNYDSQPFKAPQTIEIGSILVEFSAEYSIGVSGRTCHFSAEVIRLRGAVETSLGTARTPSYTSNNVKTHYVMSIPQTVKTNFKIGDILRIKVSANMTVATGTASPSNTFTFGTDPTDRDGTTELPNQFKVALPFKIDI